MDYFKLLLLLSITVYSSTQGVHSKLMDLRVTDHDLNVAIKYAQDYISKIQRLENSLGVSDINVEDNSPSHGQLIDSLPSPEALVHGRSALLVNKASVYLSQQHCKRNHIPQKDCINEMKKWKLDGTALRHKCAIQFGVVKCQQATSSKYRSIDGSCNNADHPIRGQAFSPYKRLLPPDYADGVQEPRRSTARRPLPAARVLSNLLVPDLDKPDRDTTLALPQWGYFIANDLFHTPVNKMVHTGSSIECCKSNGKPLTPRYVHPHCLQIVVPDNDPDYSPHGARCLNYVRSLTSLRSQCNFGPADQMNQASHYLDGSMLYGTSPNRAVALRALEGGRLATSLNNTQEFLPLSAAPEVQCQSSEDDSVCYQSGDSRVNQNPHQAGMYTLWVREHNRLANALQSLNPHWEDKQIFHEARRIVIAQIEHITYKTWLPLLLGEVGAKKYGIQLKNKGFGGSYDEDVDPTISNAFATAGFNFLNSFFQKDLRLYDETGEVRETIELQKYFNKPSITQRSGVLDGLIRGLAMQPSQKMDSSIVDDLTSKLYKGDHPFGHDIMSLDIQRSRDHGLPGYMAYRAFCKLPTTSKFDSLTDFIPKASVNKLRNVYEQPEDIDLVIGAILETPEDGAKVGPTLSCLLIEQFSRTRRGDRYFYDIPSMPHSFTEGQLNEIKKSSLTRIVCDNSASINSLQVNIFEVPSSLNKMVACSSPQIPIINLSEWKDSK